MAAGELAYDGGAVRVLVGPADLAQIEAEWVDLAADSEEPNPFYEPWLALPALAHLGAADRVLFVAVFANEEAPATGRRLVMLAPLERQRAYKGLPLRHLATWKHKYCFLCTPLVRRGRGPEALGLFTQWARTQSALVHWRHVNGDGPFHKALLDHARATNALFHVDEAYTRAFLERRSSADAYLDESLPAKSRKEFRRQERRLGEQGALVYAALAPGDDVDWWIERFLSVEESGWKGARGSALRTAADKGAFFRDAAKRAFGAGRLMLLSLTVGGRDVAMKCNFLSGLGAMTFKIGFDEGYARYSPGVLLELQNIRAFHDSDLRWMDSCAEPGHFMANRLWMDRRAIMNMLVTTGRAPGELMLSVLPLARWLARRVGRRTKPREEAP